MSRADLKKRIASRTAHVGVIGLGYVGLPLAVEFAKAGFPVTGVDLDEGRVAGVNRGESYIADVPAPVLEPLVKGGLLTATTDYVVLAACDAILICVPTPLRKTRDPDISFIVSAVDAIAATLRQDQLVILESTTYPGTTEEVILPKLDSRGFKVGQDFFLAFSPERVDPGNSRWSTRNTPKVVGGVTAACGEIAGFLYEQALEQVIRVSTCKAAEMVKLLENTFRSVNVGLVNEIALICDRLGIEVWEVIEAAATKPFGFMAFYPGPGLGGHCIPIDPHYLSWKLKTLNYYARFIELAAEINAGMPRYVVDKVVAALNRHEKSVKGSRILIVGVAYKRDVGDTRESPALDIIQLLRDRGAEVVYNDPFAGSVKLPLSSPPEPRGASGGTSARPATGLRMESRPLTVKLMKEMDCTVIVTDHTSYDYQWLVDHSRAVVDTRNATRKVQKGREKILKI